MKKLLFTAFLIVSTFAVGFPANHTGQGADLPLNLEGSQSEQQILGCIGDCGACHSLTPVEAKTILERKFDVKEILQIDIKNGYFEVEYENSKGEKEKINLLFSKDKACKEIIHLDK
ncbi:MAG: hypothetical protein GXN94_04770 [Aquificae bacterium]|nr:hypothetical protein [Aquificota bacterium]